MDDAALDLFLARCAQQLEARQSAMVRTFQFDRCDRFSIDLERGELLAECRGQAIATAQVIPIASYDPNSTFWCWAWSQSDLSVSQRQDALLLQGLTQKTGLRLFKAERFKADDELVWQLTAVACDQLQAVGCYRFNRDNHYLMLALQNVKTVARLPLAS